ncbi:thiopeptide-type bacteriocin biosynthesis protein [Nonomuraea longicatena]
MKRTESQTLLGVTPEALEEPWLQFGLTPRAGLHAELAETAGQALRDGLARDFFFMHKPPGLRIRFRPAQAATARLDLLTRERLEVWRADGLLESWRPGVYEPETYLFGGPASMHSVHRVFTADSLAWLGYHRGGPAAHGPAWAMSLLMIHSLFAGLRILGWEELGVWERVRRHRRLAPAALADPGLARLTAALRAIWPSRTSLEARLSAEAIALADTHRQAVEQESERWFRDYFESGSAAMGPRAVAAYLIVFHWNRANLPAARQGLITEALLAREAGDAE